MRTHIEISPKLDTVLQSLGSVAVADLSSTSFTIIDVMHMQLVSWYLPDNYIKLDHKLISNYLLIC